jgi:phage terminase large subunit-like protein
VHTKGRWARQRFELTDWQEHDIVRPLFGEVVHDDEWGLYVRRYRVARIVLGRKTGKSELVAALVLLLVVGDDEEGAEVYGAARDTKQAGKIGDVVVRMRQLSPRLAERLEYNKNSRRLFDETTGSWFEVITADALGELGHNPHGAYIDEVLSQRDGSLYDALRTAMGARHQPLMLLVTTETNDRSGFGAGEIDEAERVQEDPSRAPHVLAYVRKLPKSDDELQRLRDLFGNHPDLPVSTDPWDEANWRWPCPSLGEFKSWQGMRDEALEARNDPSKENAFRQFQLNQRVSQASRFVPMDLWDGCTGEVLPNPEGIDAKLKGAACVAGLDLSAKFDLTAWCLLFECGWVRWRFWLPEDMVRQLDDATGGGMGVWVRDGWVTATEGDVIDYDRVEADIAADYHRFAIRRCTYDKWSGEPVRQQIEQATGMTMVESQATYERMTEPMKALLARVRRQRILHGGNPVARWMADSLEAKTPADDPDRMRPVKPARDAANARIDGMVALLHALEADLQPAKHESVYESRGAVVM